MVRQIYKVSGMHCTSCALNIEWVLEDYGIKAQCNYAKQLLDVEFDPQKTPPEKIKQLVTGLGYSLSS